MNSKDLFVMAVRNLKRRKVRTLLSVIGVAIGTTAIVVMISLGLGLSKGQEAQVERYGNLHIIQVNSYGTQVDKATGKPSKLDDEALKKMSVLNGVTAITPTVNTYMRIVAGKYVANAPIIGIRSSTMEKFKYNIDEKGRALHVGDKNAIVIGKAILYDFYNPKKQDYAEYPVPDEKGRMPEPTVDAYTTKMFLTADMEYGNKRRNNRDTPSTDNGKKVEYKEHKVKVVGIIQNKSDSTMDENSYNIYMDYDELVKIIQEDNKARGGSSFSSTKGKTYDEVLIYAEDIKKIDAILKSIQDMGFGTSSAKDWLNQVKEQAALIQGILGGIGAISLLVAAIGITNTMIMSIYERTKEIGVMKVIGANLKDIKNLFLIEASLIGFFGGVIGLSLSIIISILMNLFMGNGFSEAGGMFFDISSESKISIIPISLGLLSIAFSTCIGVLAGYYPAKRAMGISALESLRNE
ncbi:ABC transporter permease [Filifactor villosus]|uniref:ABC transporter permease n=1 Tax=Filifactor villosus TaxID=29374 RepID=A0ABV9QLC6_9FIRM